MIQRRVLAVTQHLNRILDQASPESEAKVFDAIEELEKEFRAGITDEPIGAMIGIYNLMDELIEREIEDTTCKRGCHFCCHQNVDIWPAEAMVIERYCKEHNIQIDIPYLEKQMSIPPLEIPLAAVSACVFLKEGECSIYEARPLMCRKYFVRTDPDLCDFSKHRPTDHKIGVVANVYLEIVISALINAVGAQIPAERLPKMILKQLNVSGA